MSFPQDWKPTASIGVLQRRAAILAQIRQFFTERAVLEVETPVLSAAAVTDPHLESFATDYRGPGGGHRYLHTSPEFPMKRLLAAGSGPIYQLCRVFRQGESGRRHNPEFTLLEWYRPGWDHHALMDEVQALAELVLRGRLTAPAQRLTYAEAFMRYAELDPHRATPEALRRCVEAHGIAPVAGLAPEARNDWLDLLLTHVVEPQLGQGGLTFIHDYPADQAALARVRPGPIPVGERFELYFRGVELANGFHELGEAEEQRRRFEAELVVRRQLGLPEVPMDMRLLAALAAGLPDCAGVALGVDRLVMLALEASHIDEVLAFPVERA